MEQQKIIPGDAIIFALPKKGDCLASVLSSVLSWKDKSWKARAWKGWHVGYVVDVDAATGEITTQQAVSVQAGVCSVTYATVADMGDCKIYHWLPSPDREKIGQYAAEEAGVPYSVIAYPVTIICYLFNITWSLITHGQTCWQNMSQFFIDQGKELQPLDEMPLISKIQTSLEGDSQNGNAHISGT